jgi:threonine dehydratase
LPEVRERALKYEGLKRYFIIKFPQRPGALREFLNLLGKDDDIVFFEYIKKHSKEKGPAIVGIETSKKENFDKLIQNFEKANVDFQDITDTDIFELLIL